MQLLEQHNPSKKVVKVVGATLLVIPTIVFVFVPLSMASKITLVLLPLGFTWFMLKSSMKVWLSADELVLQMAPFPKQYVQFKSIMAINEHMAFPWAIGKRGWAYKKSPGVTVYFTGKGPGVVIELKNNKAIWLSTNKGDMLARLVR
ncbi:MAG: hypothetical protein H8E25_05940 [Planctomycetes bacterium]|nr:hypothetical protein [Planctomycetota bacterium]